jgi:Ca2+/Na+ antiporter
MKLIIQDRKKKIKSIKPLIVISAVLFLLTLYLLIIKFDYFYILIPLFLLSIVFLYLRIKKNKEEKINEKMFAELFKKY